MPRLLGLSVSNRSSAASVGTGTSSTAASESDSDERLAGGGLAGGSAMFSPSSRTTTTATTLTSGSSVGVMVQGSVGYYSMLGLTYFASKDDVQKAYKEWLKAHPGEGRDEHSRDYQEFQQVASARAVLSNDESRDGYDRIVHLRTYMNQLDDPGRTLDPFLVFPIEVTSMTGKKPRLLYINFIKKEVEICKYTERLKKFRFEDIKFVEDGPKSRPKDFTVKESHEDHYLTTDSPALTERLKAIFLLVIDNTPNITKDDCKLPPKSLIKGEAVVKKPGLDGSFGISLGYTQLLVFKDTTYRDLMDCVRIEGAAVKLKAGSEVVLEIVCPGGKIVLLEFISKEEAKDWNLRFQEAFDYHKEDSVQDRVRISSTVPIFLGEDDSPAGTSGSPLSASEDSFAEKKEAEDDYDGRVDSLSATTLSSTTSYSMTMLSPPSTKGFTTASGTFMPKISEMPSPSASFVGESGTPDSKREEDSSRSGSGTEKRTSVSGIQMKLETLQAEIKKKKEELEILIMKEKALKKILSKRKPVTFQSKLTSLFSISGTAEQTML